MLFEAGILSGGLSSGACGRAMRVGTARQPRQNGPLAHGCFCHVAECSRQLSRQLEIQLQSISGARVRRARVEAPRRPLPRLALTRQNAQISNSETADTNPKVAVIAAHNTTT